MLRWLACLVLVVLTLATGLPIVVALVSLGGDAPDSVSIDGFGALALGRVLRTAAISVLIGALATALAWPVARVTPALNRGWLVLAMLPLLVPTYLVPGAWRTLLDPSSSIGSWLLRRSVEGDINLIQLADQTLAVIGMSIWASPIAWVILHLRWRSLGLVIESIGLEGAGPVRRQVALLNLGRSAIVRSVVVVGLVMLAQTVAFDLAQIETISNAVRVSVSLGRPGEAWLIASPVLVIALGVGIWFALAGTMRAPATQSARPTGGWRTMVVLVPLMLGVLLPTLMLAGSIRDIGAIERFVRRSSHAMAWTLLNAVVVGGVALLLGAAVLVALRESRRSARASVGIFAMLALIPGVLLGAAVARAFNTGFMPVTVGDSPLPLWIAHVGRFGVVACLGAMWVRAIEPGELDDLARLRGPTLRGWMLADAPRHVPALVGVALVVAALSVHEIEAAVLLQPVGTDGLARFMLDLLHYQRRDDLAAGVLLLGGMSILLAIAGGILACRTLGANPRRL